MRWHEHMKFLELTSLCHYPLRALPNKLSRLMQHDHKLDRFYGLRGRKGGSL